MTITKRKEKERLEAKKKAKFSIERPKEMGSKRMQDKFILRNTGEAEARYLLLGTTILKTVMLSKPL